jgi:hypothetical protein
VCTPASILSSTTTRYFGRGSTTGSGQDWYAGNKELAVTVGDFLQKLKAKHAPKKIWVVMDPVMITTSGQRLIDDRPLRP